MQIIHIDGLSRNSIYLSAFAPASNLSDDLSGSDGAAPFVLEDDLDWSNLSGDDRLVGGTFIPRWGLVYPQKMCEMHVIM